MDQPESTLNEKAHLRTVFQNFIIVGRRGHQPELVSQEFHHFLYVYYIQSRHIETLAKRTRHTCIYPTFRIRSRQVL